MGRRGPRRESGWSDLEALDPATGEAVRADDPGPAPRPLDSDGRLRRRRRLQRSTAALTVLALVCGGVAGHRAWSILSVRAIDRTWAEAMALDRARKAADASVLELSRSLGDGNDESRRASLERIGEEVTAGLLRHEDRLRRRWILDDRIDAVRDDMLEALQFRRFQLSPNRAILGDRPLVRVEEDLEAQLHRFGLERSTAPLPPVRSARSVIAGLRRFTSEPTGTVLVAVSGTRLLTIDVDASTIRTRALPAVPQRLFGAHDLAVVQTEDGFVTGYPLDPGAPPVWTVPGSTAVPGGRGADATGVVAWVQTGEGVVAIGDDGRPRPPVPLASDLELLAQTDFGLLVRDVRGALHLHDPTTGRRQRTLPVTGRFAGASNEHVAVQRPGRPVLAILQLSSDGAGEVALPRTDAASLVARPGSPGEFAFAAGPLAGNVASVLLIDTRGWQLTGFDGPRATVEPGSLTWSRDGVHLFWATPDGRIAHRGMEHLLVLRAPLADVTQVAAFPAPPRR